MFGDLLINIDILWWRVKTTEFKVMNLRKVDFFWINREQRSFEWSFSPHNWILIYIFKIIASLAKWSWIISVRGGGFMWETKIILLLSSKWEINNYSSGLYRCSPNLRSSKRNREEQWKGGTFNQSSKVPWILTFILDLNFYGIMLWPTIKTRFLDMHMYITSALQKTDMKAVGLQLALELLHEKVKITTISRLLLKIFNYIKSLYPAIWPSCPGPIKMRHWV